MTRAIRVWIVLIIVIFVERKKICWQYGYKPRDQPIQNKQQYQQTVSNVFITGATISNLFSICLNSNAFRTVWNTHLTAKDRLNIFLWKQEKFRILEIKWSSLYLLFKCVTFQKFFFWFLFYHLICMFERRYPVDITYSENVKLKCFFCVVLFGIRF